MVFLPEYRMTRYINMGKRAALPQDELLLGEGDTHHRGFLSSKFGNALTFINLPTYFICFAPAMPCLGRIHLL